VASRERKTILLIDDDARLLRSVGDRLQFEGFHVLESLSVESGLRTMRKQPPDLIILDLGLPGMNGVTFLNQISTDGKPSYPVLVFSARTEAMHIRERFAVDGVVCKSQDPDDLVAETRRILAEHAAGGNPAASGSS
jgi:two-component system, OmpR family, KDP operon response regulator KdpE